jgi:hypothetical protein
LIQTTKLKPNMKKLLQFSLLSFLLLSVLFSCKKDDKSDIINNYYDTIPDYGQSLAGKWKYLSGKDVAKYLEIYPNKVYSILTADNQGIRDEYKGVLSAFADQIIFDDNSFQELDNKSVYNYILKGDTLKLTRPDENIVLLKDVSAPDTLEWIKRVTSEAKFNAPINDLTDIAYDGALLWYGNAYATHYIYKINPTNFATDSIMVNKYAWAIESDDPYLWVSDDGSSTVSKIDKSTGNVIFTSIDLGPWIYGIAKDENYLWCYSNNENRLYKYNTTDNTIPLSTEIESRWNGMTNVGNYLYVAANGKLHKCIKAPLMGISSFELPGYNIYGVTYDGVSFWVSASKSYNDWPEIIKLSGVN